MFLNLLALLIMTSFFSPLCVHCHVTLLLLTCHRFVCSYFACMYISHLLHFFTSSTWFTLLFINCLHDCLMLCYYSLVICVDRFFHCHFFSFICLLLTYFYSHIYLFVTHFFFFFVFVSNSTSLGTIVAFCVGVGTWNYQSFKPSFCLVSPFFS